MFVAGLPMYDLPRVRPHLDTVWGAVARRLRAAGVSGVPSELDRRNDLDVHWSQPNLLLSQVCGVEVVQRLEGQVHVLGTAQPSAPGCRGHDYFSYVVVRASSGLERIDQLRDRRLAVNCFFSHSGSTSLIPLVAPLSHKGRFFSDIVPTGGHRQSVDCVREGWADVAAVDCTTWMLLQRHQPSALHGLTTIAQSPHAPAPPFVTRVSDPATRDILTHALQEGLADPATAAARRAVGILGFAKTDVADYQSILNVLQQGKEHDYFELQRGTNVRPPSSALRADYRPYHASLSAPQPSRGSAHP